MADNYLGKQYEDYEARKAAWEKAKKCGKTRYYPNKSRKKKKDQKDSNSTNANVVIVPEKRETLCNIFATNLKALELQNFFKKTTYTSDELNAMKKEKYICEVLGDEFSRTYLDIKKQEWNEYMMQVSDWEVSRYLRKM